MPSRSNSKCYNVSNALFSLLFVIWIVNFTSALDIRRWCQEDEDAALRTPDLIRKYGYNVESHDVTTEDGYILTHHRIPPSSMAKLKRKPVVVLQHGLLGSSSDWLLTTPSNALGYLLADEGYDVWLLNTRGNEYSEKHTTLNPIFNRRQFWHFSFHEVGIYDLPNSIDYILNVTQSQGVFHVGHSMGTTALYVMLSERPEYNEKVYLHVSYAPIAYIKHTVNPLFRLLGPIQRLGGLRLMRFFLGDFNFAPSTRLLRSLTSIACHDGEVTQIFCSTIYMGMMGYNPSQFNTTLLPVFFGHFPVGSSTMQLTHYIQEMNSGKFRQFDYGFTGNMQKYNSPSPPDYKCSNVRIPLHTFYGGKDAFAQLEDVEKLHNLLPNLRGKHFINNWAHMDFLYGIDAKTEVYNKTIGSFNEFQNVEGKSLYKDFLNTMDNNDVGENSLVAGKPEVKNI